MKGSKNELIDRHLTFHNTNGEINLIRFLNRNYCVERRVPSQRIASSSRLLPLCNDHIFIVQNLFNKIEVQGLRIVKH